MNIFSDTFENIRGLVGKVGDSLPFVSPRSSRLHTAQDDEKVFGVLLQELPPETLVDGGVPICVFETMEFINSHFIDTEGLYRIPGSYSRINAFKAAFDAGETVEFSPDEFPGNLTSLVLHFLRELPGSLFSFQGLQNMRNIKGKTDDERLEQVRQVLVSIPPENYACTRAVFNHLHKVANHSAKNKMTADNLAICIFGTSGVSRAAILMITHWSLLFHSDPSLNPQRKKKFWSPRKHYSNPAKESLGPLSPAVSRRDHASKKRLQSLRQVPGKIRASFRMSMNKKDNELTQPVYHPRIQNQQAGDSQLAHAFIPASPALEPPPNNNKNKSPNLSPDQSPNQSPNQSPKHKAANKPELKQTNTQLEVEPVVTMSTPTVTEFTSQTRRPPGDCVSQS